MAVRPLTARTARPAVVGALGALYVIWGSTYLAIRVVVSHLPPLLMASARFVPAGIVLIGFVIWRHGWGAVRSQIGWAQVRAASIVGAFLILGGNGLVSWAVQHIDSGAIALIIGAMPLWMSVLDRVVYGTRLAQQTVIGIALGVVGLVLLMQPWGEGAIKPLPAAVGLVAALSWAWGSLWARRAPLPENGALSTGLQMIMGGGLQALVGLASGEATRFHPSTTPMSAWAALLYLVLFGSLVAFSSYGWLLKNVRLSLVSTYAFVNPVVAVVLGWIILNEDLTVRMALAGAVIVVGVALMITAKPIAQFEDDDHLAAP